MIRLIARNLRVGLAIFFCAAGLVLGFIAPPASAASIPSTTPPKFVPKATLTAIVLSDASFGSAVAVSGNTALAGAASTQIGLNTYEGAAYIYTNTGGTWGQAQMLTASDGYPFDRFGNAVAIEGTTAAIGASGRNYSVGAVYIFTRDAGSGMWLQSQILTPSPGYYNELFGNIVALSGDTLLVGSPYINNDAGLVYVFTRTNGTWAQSATITAPDAAQFNFFGENVALSGHTAIIAAPSKSTGGFRVGAVYIFANDGTGWKQQLEVQGIIKQGKKKSTLLSSVGYGIALDGDTAIIQSLVKKSSILNVYRRTAGVWTTSKSGFKTKSSPMIVALKGNIALYEMYTGKGQGLIAVLSLSGTKLTQAQILTPGNPKGYSYGNSLAFDGTTILYGSYGNPYTKPAIAPSLSTFTQ